MRAHAFSIDRPSPASYPKCPSLDIGESAMPLTLYRTVLPNPLLLHKYTLFGHSYDHWQSILFCIAAHSISADSLTSTYKKIVEDRTLQVHERVDTLVALHATDNQNMLLNGVVEPKDGIPLDNSINFLPYPGSSICTYCANEPWSLFVMLLLNYMIQAPTEPVNMLLYGGNDPY